MAGFGQYVSAAITLQTLENLISDRVAEMAEATNQLRDGGWKQVIFPDAGASFPVEGTAYPAVRLPALGGLAGQISDWHAACHDARMRYAGLSPEERRVVKSPDTL